MRSLFFIVSVSLPAHFAISQAQPFKVPIAVAHRGGAEFFPENTLNAFQSAINIGADAIECDVGLTADGESIVMHDETYSRTTNIMEVFGADKRINELTLAQVRTLSITGGNGWNSEHSGLIRIPTFEEVVKLIRDSTTMLFVDLKDPAVRNHENVLEILREAGLSMRRVVFGGMWNSAFTPVDAKQALWVTGNPQAPPSPRFDSTGIELDGTFFLTLRDTALRCSEFNFEFDIPEMWEFDTTQYLYELTSYRDLSQWSSGLRFIPPDIVQASLRSSTGNISLISRVGFAWPLNVKVQKSSDSLRLFINGVLLKSIGISPGFESLSSSRLMIGSDRQGNRRFRGKMNSAIFIAVGDTLAAYRFAASGVSDCSENRRNLQIMSFAPPGVDIIGQTFAQYDPGRMKWFSEMGYEGLVWTVNDPNMMVTILKDSAARYVMTDNPKLFWDVANGMQSLGETPTPGGFELSQNYPNPFNGVTLIYYFLAENGNSKISVFDILGREIRTLINGYSEKGRGLVVWDGLDGEGRAVSTGTYFWLLSYPGGQQVRKMLVLR